MPTTESVQATHIGQRWPVALAILAVLFLLAALPGRIRLFPAWLPYAVGIVVLTPIAAVSLASARVRWLRVERAVTLLFCGLIVIGTAANLAFMVSAMLRRSGEITGAQLLTSSIAVWVTNVLAFSLVYWQLDRGGPIGRLNSADRRPDWLFPHEGQPSDVVPPGWRPVFVDYLYLAYSTATAFSATDALPLTARAKILMMVDSTISLLIVVVIAARAISLIS